MKREKKSSTCNTEQFKRQVAVLRGDEYEVLGEYQYSTTPILMRHKICGHEWRVRPNNFLRGTKCPACHIHSRKTTQWFKQEVALLTGEEYEVLEDYQLTDIPILMRHTRCGHEWKVKPNGFLHGTRCPACSPRAAKLPSRFYEEVRNQVKDEYEVLTPYQSSSTFVLMKHRLCGHIWEVRPNRFLSGTRCPQCAIKKRTKTHQTFVEEVNRLTNDEYVVLGTYLNTNTPVLMQHHVCGHQWSPFPYNFLRGTRCPKCMARNRSVSAK